MRFNCGICAAALAGLLLAGCGGAGGSDGAGGRNGLSSRIIQTSGYQFDFQGERAQRADDGALEGEIESIVVDHQFGTVSVSAVDGPPSWSWEVTCWADTPERAQKLAEEVVLEVHAEAGRHSWTLVLPEPPVDDLRGVESHLTLNVPAAARVELKNAHGPTSIDGITGGTTAACRHGRLELRNLQGELTAGTEHGELVAEHVPGGSLTNRHGKLTASDVAGDLQAQTAHAALSISGVRGSVQAENEHGTVEAQNVAGSLQVGNQHGKITVESVEAGVDLETSFGTIAVTGVGGEARLRNSHGAIEARSVAGRIDAQTQHGAIDLETPAPEVVAKNEHGKIRIVLTDPGFRRVRAETSFAGLEVEFPPGANPRVEAGTEYGKIDSDVPVLQLNPRADNFAGLDDDAPRMSLKNQHGNIRFRRTGGGR